MGRIEEAVRRTAADTGSTGPGRNVQGEPGEPVPWQLDEQPVIRPAQTGPSESHAGAALRTSSDVAMLAGDRGRLRLFRGFSGLVADRLVVSRSASPALVEQYRHLAATLHHAQLSQGLRTLMVTSARPREGKTLTATNMALILAESYGRKVLLIDADLRRPSLHETFQLPNVSGLNEGLKAESDEKLALLEISEGLTLLPAGRPDPDPLSGLSSPRMKKIIGEAAAMFDWVIVDTPPVGLIADANIIAGMVDATLLVVRAGVTPYKEAESAVATLGRARVLGIVLNGIELDHAAARDYYYRHYQAPGDREREAR